MKKGIELGGAAQTSCGRRARSVHVDLICDPAFLLANSPPFTGERVVASASFVLDTTSLSFVLLIPSRAPSCTIIIAVVVTLATVFIFYAEDVPDTCPRPA